MDNKSTLKLAAILLVAVGLISFLGYSSFQKYQSIAELEARINAKNNELSSAEKKLEKLIALSQNRNLLVQKRNLFETVIPKTPKEREIYEYIKGIADTYNVFIEAMEFQERVERENYREMPIALQIAGSYSGVIHVLDDIQRGERMFNIMELNISKGSAGNIRAAAKIEAFYRPSSLQPSDQEKQK